MIGLGSTSLCEGIDARYENRWWLRNIDEGFDEDIAFGLTFVKKDDPDVAVPALGFAFDAPAITGGGGVRKNHVFIFAGSDGSEGRRHVFYGIDGVARGGEGLSVGREKFGLITDDEYVICHPG
jgi:hypothetical protein